MKKGILILSILVAVNCFAYDTDSFKNGFEAGLKALKFQVNNEGVVPKKIAFKKKHLVVLPIEKISISEVLFLQYMANKEDFETNLTTDEIIFGNFDRLVDAQQAKEKLLNLFGITASIEENKKIYFSNPIIATPVFKQVANQLEKEGKIVEVKIVRIEPAKEEAKKPKAPTNLVIKNAELKNGKAQAYKLIGSSKNPKNFVETFVVEKQGFRTARSERTTSDEVFVKVLNENIYFLESDVEIK